MTQRRPKMHGRDHGPGGPDRIPPGAWHLVGDTGEPAFENGWDNVGGAFQPMRFRWLLDDGVELQGSVTGGASGTVIFTLPADFCPPNELRLSASDSDGAFVVLRVLSDGSVIGGV